MSKYGLVKSIVLKTLLPLTLITALVLLERREFDDLHSQAVQNERREVLARIIKSQGQQIGVAVIIYQNIKGERTSRIQDLVESDMLTDIPSLAIDERLIEWTLNAEGLAQLHIRNQDYSYLTAHLGEHSRAFCPSLMHEFEDWLCSDNGQEIHILHKVK